MKKQYQIYTLLIALALSVLNSKAGPYSPGVGLAGADAIAHDDEQIIAWATEIEAVALGSHVELSQWGNTDNALGAAQDGTHHIVSLGRGGTITLFFEAGIANGPGADFAVFENSFDGNFIELAFVEISSDGEHFYRFQSSSLTSHSVAQFGQVDPSELNNLAGKHIKGYGTPFDIAELAGHADLNLANVRFVRLIDIIGDGRVTDADGRQIYDPYPTIASAGFDLDAVGVINKSGFPEIWYHQDGWVYSEALGWFAASYYPWINRADGRWWYLVMDKKADFWVWDSDLSWVWLTKEFYPWVLRGSDWEWVYVE